MLLTINISCLAHDAWNSHAPVVSFTDMYQPWPRHGSITAHQYSVRWTNSSIPKLQRLHSWSLGIDK